MPKRISSELEVEVLRLAGTGLGLREIGRRVGCSRHAVTNALVREKRPATDWNPSPARLSLADREEIRAGLERGDTFTAIAACIGRVVSTISREVGSNGGRDCYQAWRAHDSARGNARRPKTPKLSCPRLALQVTEWLEEWWSPQEISQRLHLEFPQDPMMRVSHETIYQSLYVQGRGELRRELHRCLRRGRARRRPQGRLNTRGQIPNMVMISERPAEIEERAVPGHWEGDLIIGQNDRSAVGTLVERTSRFVLLLHLPNGREAAMVDQAMRTAIQVLPVELMRSIPWDQGKELAKHAQFTIDTNVAVYFCDPHSPWQRGSNENTNGLLRQYMPKGTDLSVHSAEDLARFAASLNNRPRKTLGFMKPSETLAAILASDCRYYSGQHHRMKVSVSLPDDDVEFHGPSIEARRADGPPDTKTASKACASRRVRRAAGDYGTSVKGPALGCTTVKWRRSSVATSLMESRSAVAITEASTVPSGKS